MESGSWQFLPVGSWFSCSIQVRNGTKIIFSPLLTLCITVKKRNIVENGLLKSRRQAPPQDNVKGSLYQMIDRMAQDTISSKGDRTFLRDYFGDKELKTSEALVLSKK